MNWLQWYEVLACALLLIVCVVCNARMGAYWLTRTSIALLGVSAAIRMGALVTKHAEVESVSRTISLAADSSIPLMAAIAIGSIVWHRIRVGSGVSQCADE